MRTLLCLSLVLASGMALAGRPQDPAVFRASGDTVQVYVTVTDKSDRLVPGLAREQFEIRDNGRAQPLTLFDNSPQPIRLVVLLDVSGSMARNLPLMRAACEQLFARLRPDDAARVGTFGSEITISPSFTRDARQLMDALPRGIDPMAPTPLWRAMDKAMDTFGDAAGRRVVLVLSDGKDSGTGKFGERYIGQPDTVERARREDVMIYGVGLSSRQAFQRMPAPGENLAALMASDFPDPGLGTAATDTGGGYFELRPRDDLEAIFARVADELHGQYLMGFAPPARDGKVHKIDVRVSVKDLEARARKNYLAPKAAR